MFRGQTLTVSFSGQLFDRKDPSRSNSLLKASEAKFKYG